MVLSLYRRGALKAAAKLHPSRLLGQVLVPAALTALLALYGNNAAAFDFNDVAVAYNYRLVLNSAGRATALRLPQRAQEGYGLPS